MFTRGGVKPIRGARIIVAEPIRGHHYSNLKRLANVESLIDYVSEEYRIFPTSGLMAIFHFIKQNGSVHIFGFSSGGDHYYDAEHTSVPTPHHDMLKERNIISSLIDEGKVKLLTDLQ